jgi:hypothetical protein
MELCSGMTINESNLGGDIDVTDSREKEVQGWMQWHQEERRSGTASPNFVKGPDLNRERIFSRTRYGFPAIDSYVTDLIFPLITYF